MGTRQSDNTVQTNIDLSFFEFLVILIYHDFYHAKTLLYAMLKKHIMYIMLGTMWCWCSPLSSVCSASVLLWGVHRAGILQRHCVADGLRRPLSEMDRVSRLCHAVPGPRSRWPQLLQEPGSRVQPLVLFQTKLRSHRVGVLRLPPGWVHGKL